MTASPEPNPARSAPATLRVRQSALEDTASTGSHRAERRPAGATRWTAFAGREGERSLSELITAASNDLSALVRNEVALAKAEVRAEAKDAIAGAVGFVVAGVFGFLALVMLLFAAAYGLFALGLPRWLSFLIVGVVLLVLAGILALVGKSRLGFRNTNLLIGKPDWVIHVQKTGFTNDAGQCLLMEATIDERPVIMVFLNSFGSLTRTADARRVRKWMAAQNTARVSVAGAATK